MGMTKALNSAESFWCTTYFGGPERGICYDFTMIRDGVKVMATLTEEELFQKLAGHESSKVILDDKIRPQMDRF